MNNQECLLTQGLVVHRRASRCLQEDGVIVCPIFIVRFDNIEVFLLAETEKKKYMRMWKPYWTCFESILLRFGLTRWKKDQKSRLCILLKKCWSLSVKKRICSCYILCSTKYYDQWKFSSDILEFQNQVQHIFASNKSRPSKRMQNCFMSIAVSSQKIPELSVAKVLLQFCMNI